MQKHTITKTKTENKTVTKANIKAIKHLVHICRYTHPAFLTNRTAKTNRYITNNLTHKKNKKQQKRNNYKSKKYTVECAQF